MFLRWPPVVRKSKVEDGNERIPRSDSPGSYQHAELAFELSNQHVESDPILPDIAPIPTAVMNHIPSRAPRGPPVGTFQVCYEALDADFHISHTASACMADRREN